MKELDRMILEGHKAAIFAAEHKLSTEDRSTRCPCCGWPMMRKEIEPGMHSFACNICRISMTIQTDSDPVNALWIGAVVG